MRQLLDVPEAMVEAFDVPNSDRYQAKNSGDGVFFTYMDSASQIPHSFTWEKRNAAQTK